MRSNEGGPAHRGDQASDGDGLVRAVTCIDVLDRVPLTVAALVENRIAANLAEPIGPIFLVRGGDIPATPGMMRPTLPRTRRP